MPLTELIDYSGWNKSRRPILYDDTSNIITGDITITGVGHVDVIYSETNSLLYISGQSLIKSIFIDQPTHQENFSAFFVDRNIYPQKIVSVCYGSSLGWELRQSSNISVNGTLILSGFTNTNTTGTTYTTFNSPVISGDTFAIFRTQYTGGSVTGFGLTMIHG